MEAFLECPSCGHQLSMYRAPEPGSGEQMAAQVAARVATWWFPTAILVAVALWVVVNVAARPFQPYPVVVLAWISASNRCRPSGAANFAGTTPGGDE